MQNFKCICSGACTVIHYNDAINQPEIISEKNCLVGKNGEEVSNLVYKAYKDIELEKIRIEARKLYLNNFSPDVSTPIVLDKLKELLNKMEFKIDKTIITKNTDPYIIAEACDNHFGKIDYAIKMIEGQKKQVQMQ